MMDDGHGERERAMREEASPLALSSSCKMVGKRDRKIECAALSRQLFVDKFGVDPSPVDDSTPFGNRSMSD